MQIFTVAAGFSCETAGRLAWRSCHGTTERLSSNQLSCLVARRVLRVESLYTRMTHTPITVNCIEGVQGSSSSAGNARRRPE